MSISRRWITILTLSTIIMFASGCGGETGGKPDVSLSETYWRLTSLNGAVVVSTERQREAHLVLKTEEQRVAGSGGCNRIMGGYKLEGQSLSFTKMAGTMMACPNMDEEQRFLKTLGTVNGFSISGETMQMSKDGDVILEFQAVALP